MDAHQNKFLWPRRDSAFSERRMIAFVNNQLGSSPSGSPEPSPKEKLLLFQLNNHSNWVDIFNKNPAILQGSTAIQNAATESFEEHVNSLKLEERQKIFVDYVDLFIPESVQKDPLYASLFLPGAPLNTRIAEMIKPGNLETVLHVLGGILGITKLTPPLFSQKEIDIATASARAHYGIGTSAIYNPTKALVSDFRDAMKVQALPGTPAVNSPSQFVKDLHPSRLLGAVNLGVVDTPLLTELFQDAESATSHLNVSKSNVSRNLEKLNKETQISLRAEAVSLTDQYNSLSGGEKLVFYAVVASVLYAAYKYPKTVGTSVFALAASYFSAKMIFKVDSPLDTFGEVVGKGLKSLGIRQKNGKPPFPNYSPTEIPERASIMVNFLSEYERAKLDEEATGFSLLSEMSLSELSKNLQGNTITTFQLDMNGTSSLKQSMIALAKKQGIRFGFEKFFSNSHNLDQTSDAVAFLFYTIARQNPQHRALAETVEKGMAQLDANQTVHDLHDEYLVAYETLVNLGRGMTLEDPRSLRTYILDTVHSPQHHWREYIHVPGYSDLKIPDKPAVPGEVDPDKPSTADRQIAPDKSSEADIGVPPARSSTMDPGFDPDAPSDDPGITPDTPADDRLII